MKPPACVRNKWGSGTTCERPPETAAAKEVENKLAQIMAERVKQDANWFSIQDGQTKTASSPSNGPGNTGK